MSDEYPRVGGRTGVAGDVHCLMVSDFVTALQPPPNTFDPIDPQDYFITSGDAIQKTRQLCQDLTAFSHKLQSLMCEQKSKELSDLEEATKTALAGCLRMKQSLETVRGPAVFLETEWERGFLLVIPKNPRLRP